MLVAKTYRFPNWLLLAITLGLLLPASTRTEAQEATEAAPAKKKRRGKRVRPLPELNLEKPIANVPSPGAAPPGQPGAAAIPELKPFETGLDYEPTSPRAQVTFNLQDADLMDLVRLISQITGKRFILPSTTRSIKATVYAPTKVSAAEAYQAFLSILELNGMALVPAGRYLKIVESGKVEGRPIPLFTGDESVPVGDRFVTRLEHVDNIAAEDAATLLERFKSGDGALTAYAPTNMLIITDTGTNIHRMLRILNVVDVARTGEQIWVEPVHHASAADVAARLTEIFEPGATTAGAAPARKGRKEPPVPAPTGTVGAASGEARLTKILADERTNSIIILATERAYLRILEMLKYLDVSMEGEGRIHVHHLQHSDSEEISATLQSLVGGSAAPAKGAPAAGGTASIFEGKVAITAHKASNALVITASAHDYAAIRGVIDILDTQRKQVFIEAVIMELSVNRGSSLGVAFHGGVPDLPTDGSVSVLGFQAGKTIGGITGMAASGETLTGLAVGVQGPELPGLSLPAFGVAVNALSTAGDADILATPHLIATDNVEAEISVGQNVALQTSSGLGGGLGNLGALAGLAGQQGNAAGGLGGLGGLGALGALSGFGGAVPRQDVGTTVKITPHINESNEIRLEISEEISAAGAPSGQGQGVRDIDRTRAKTEVVARDQQTVVIGGLMRDAVTTEKTKVPVLGDLPLLGALFRSTNKTKVKKNLLLFLTPYVIRSPADLRSIYERKMRERQEFLDRYFVFGDSGYEPPVDYSRTRGLLAEIMLELKSMDETRKLAAEAAALPERIHEPRPPVGQAPDSAMTVGEGDVVVEPEGESAAEGAPTGDAPAAVDPPTPPPEQAPPPPPEVIQ